MLQNVQNVPRGDFTALMANFGEIATVGAAARADCDFGTSGPTVPWGLGAQGCYNVALGLGCREW